MVIADWDEDGGSAAFEVEGHVHYVDSDDVEMIPAVRAGRSLGWEPAPESPFWCFLPAIWPVAFRAWVTDIRVRHGTLSCSDQPAGRVPWSTAEYADFEQSMNVVLSECGLTDRPAGRVWLLRPPADFDSVQGCLQELENSARAAGLAMEASPALVNHIAAELRRLFA